MKENRQPTQPPGTASRGKRLREREPGRLGAMTSRGELSGSETRDSDDPTGRYQQKTGEIRRDFKR